MHELSLTQEILEIVCTHAQGQPVVEVVLEIGELSGVSAEAIAFCFDICRQNTVAAQAELIVIPVAGLGRCRRCGQDVALDVPFGVCTCGSTEITILNGREFQLKTITLNPPEEDILCVLPAVAMPRAIPS